MNPSNANETSPISGFSRPRLNKHRKGPGFQNQTTRSSEIPKTTHIDLGFNPFRPISTYPGTSSSGSPESFVFRANKAGSTPGFERKSVAEELKSLRISGDDSTSNNSSADIVASKVLPQEMESLDIDGFLGNNYKLREDLTKFNIVESVRFKDNVVDSYELGLSL